LFDEQGVDYLVEAVQRFEKSAASFSPERAAANAQRFSKERFKTEFGAMVRREWTQFAHVPAR
jgi:hypothetical protein